MMDVYQAAIEELALSGEVSLGRVSTCTLRRYVRNINERLAAEKAPWRVKGDRTDMSLYRVCYESEAEKNPPPQTLYLVGKREINTNGPYQISTASMDRKAAIIAQQLAEDSNTDPTKEVVLLEVPMNTLCDTPDPSSLYQGLLFDGKSFWTFQDGKVVKV